MSVYRGVFFFRSDDESFWAVRKHKSDDFNPDKYADSLPYRSCSFTINGKRELLKVVDLRNGNVYYPDPSCPIIQG